MKKLIIIIYLIFSIQSYAEENHRYDNLISLSENLAYNFDFDSSLSVIQQAKLLLPDRPEAFLLEAQIHLWFYLGSKSKSDYDLFFNLSDSILTRTENLISNSEKKKELLYYLGNVYKFRAIAYGTAGNTLDAFWSTKNAVSLYEEVVEIDSNFYSAYGGIGIFEYALSYVPALFNWALTLSGLTADQKNGFEYIEKAATLGKKDKIEYNFHLAKLYDEHYADYKKSLAILNDLLKKYKDNILFRYQSAIANIKSRNLDKAVTDLEIILNVNHPKFTQTNSFSYFLLGDIYFRKGNFREALNHYLTFLTTTNTIDYTGIASLRTAYCYHFLDNESEFKRYSFLAANGNHDLEDDSYASEMSIRLLENGLNEDQEFLIKIENGYLAGKDSQIIDTIGTYVDSLVTDYIMAEIIYYESSGLINLNKFQKAKTLIEQTDTLNFEQAPWVKPLLMFNLAQIYYKENNFIAALKLLEKAEDENDFQKKNLIQSNINGLRKKIMKAY